MGKTNDQTETTMHEFKDEGTCKVAIVSYFCPHDLRKSSSLKCSPKKRTDPNLSETGKFWKVFKKILKI